MEQNAEILRKAISGSLKIIEQDREKEIIMRRFGLTGRKETLEQIGEMLALCAELLEAEGAFLVLNLYSMGLSALLARTAVRQAFPQPRCEEAGELYFADRFEKELPLGTYYRARF
jgi:hypothetical protein